MKNKKQKKGGRYLEMVKRLYFLLFKNCQTSFLHLGQKEEYPRKGFCVYYDSYADFKRQQKRTRAISFSTFGVIISLVIVELCINLIFPVIFRSEASGGKKWTQDRQSEFLAEQGSDDVYIGNKISLKAAGEAVNYESKGDFSGGTTPSADGLSQSAVSGLSNARIGINQGYFINTKTALPLLSDQVMDVSYDDASGYLLVSTLGGLTVIDTRKTAVSADDVVVKNFVSEPGGLSNNQVYQSMFVSRVLYVATGGGLDIFSLSDDGSFVKSASLNVKSQPALSYNKIKGMNFDKGLLFVSTDGGGLDVIDTKNTVEQTDDTLLGVYDKKSFPGLDTDRIRNSYIDGKMLYVDTWGGGLVTIDTKGTFSLSDDELIGGPIKNGNINSSSVVDGHVLVGISQGGLAVVRGDKVIGRYLPGMDVSDLSYDESDGFVYASVNGGGLYVFAWDDGILEQLFHYDRGSFPALVNDNMKSIAIGTNKEIYLASEDAGLSVITPGTCNGKGVFVSRPEDIGSLRPIGAAWSVIGNPDKARLLIRQGDERAVWEWSGDSQMERINDLWGGVFEKITKEKAGVMFSGRSNEKRSASFYIKASDTKRDFLPGSIIRMKVKADSQAENLSGVLFVDDWNGSGCYFSPGNDWQIVTCVADTAFSMIGLNLRWSDGWRRDDNLVISSLTIENQSAGWKEWKALAMHNGYADVGIEDDAKWWQYRVELTSDDGKTSPQIEKLAFFDKYKKAGEYLSPVINASGLSEWGMFKVLESKPQDTDLLFYVRGRNSDMQAWSDWQKVSNGEKINFSSYSLLQYRAQLFTSNEKVSPRFSNVEVTYFNIFE